MALTVQNYQSRKTSISKQETKAHHNLKSCMNRLVIQSRSWLVFQVSFLKLHENVLLDRKNFTAGKITKTIYTVQQSACKMINPLKTMCKRNDLDLSKDSLIKPIK